MWCGALRRLAIGVVLGVAVAACAERATREMPQRSTRSARRAEIQLALSRLRTHETALRAKTDFARVVPASRSLGPDPYRLCRVGDRLVGVLRGSSELVLLSDDLRELSRVAAPERPVDCAVTEREQIAVVGQRQRELVVYRVQEDRLVTVARHPLAMVGSPRALAVQGQSLFLSDEAEDRVFAFRLGDQGALEPRGSVAVCRRPFALQVAGNQLVIACQLEHALSVRRIEGGQLGAEVASVVHDGPVWGLSAIAWQGSLLLAASGVEDHPLERFRGAFGYVDSFVYVLRVEPSGQVSRLHALNTSDAGALVPKGLLLSARPDGSLDLLVTAYGSEPLLRYHFERPDLPPSLRASPFVPGVSAVVASGEGIVAASPLLDGWARWDERGVQRRAVASELPEPSFSRRLGEALVFTRWIAPTATSQGKNSRFTCETCHFEGGIDGRVHHTGRADVRVTTRPLFGLFANAPHFSRALDPDLTSVSHNEFRVAGLANPYDPWFSLDAADLPWLPNPDGLTRYDPELLRRAFIDFLAAFEPDENFVVDGRQGFDDEERRGAALFRDRCASCHAPRLATDRAGSEVAFEGWESLIFSEAGPITWARGDYAQSGIVPYVHERGTRIPSLRRVSRKWPYFTNGSAHSLSEVVAAARWTESAFYHAGAPTAAAGLAPDDVKALVSFLALL